MLDTKLQFEVYIKQILRCKFANVATNYRH